MEGIKVESPEIDIMEEPEPDEMRVDCLIKNTSLATFIIRVKNVDQDRSSSDSSEESSETSSEEDEEAHTPVNNALPAVKASLPYLPGCDEEFIRLRSKYKLRQCYVSLERCPVPKSWRTNNNKNFTTETPKTHQFECLISSCNKSFNRIADRNHHMLSLHSENRPMKPILPESSCPCKSDPISKRTGAKKALISFKCKVCNTEFIKSSFTENKFLCEHSTCSCNKTSFLNFEDLMAHHRKVCSVTTSAPVECPECGQEFHMTQCLLSHQYHAHPTVHKKTSPGFHACSCSTSLIDSVKDQDQLIYFSCKKCKQEFKKADFLDELNQLKVICHHSACAGNERFTDFHEFFLHHRKVCPQQGFESQSCSECGLEFFNEQCWIAHRVNTHDLERPYECHICHKVYSRFSHLTEHKYSHMEKKHQCETCGAAFVLPSNLRAHIDSVHVKELKRQCGVCGKKFIDATALSHHKDAHKPKTLPCPTCGQLCRSPRHLREHIYRVHERRRQQLKKLKVGAAKKVQQQYVCDMCGAVYKSTAGLQHHMTLAHDDSIRTDLTCAECGKKCSGRSNLKRHMEKHLPHTTPCFVCGKLFKSQAHVNTHVYYVHDKRRRTKTSETETAAEGEEDV